MSWYWIALLEGAWVVGVGVWITNERRAPAATIAWIVVLALLPGVGLPVYLLIGPRHLERKRVRYGGLIRHLRKSLETVDLEHAVPPDTVRQVKLALRLDQAPITTATRIVIHRDGVSAFDAIARAIEAAREAVHVEFYIYECDALGRRLRDLLARRAAEGIAVRLIVDSAGARAGDRFFAPLVAAGGQVVRFNPLRLGLRYRLLNFRTHRKIVVVDGRVGFLGGMNVSDCQTVGVDGHEPWRDSMLEAEGRIVRGMQRAFLEDWCFACAREFEEDPRHFPDLPTGPHWMQVVRSGPDRDVYPIHEFFFSAIAAADRRVWITCPYLVPDEAILTAIVSAAHRGVDVRLLVARRSDSRLVDAAVRSFYDDWLAAGARVFEYGPAMLHAKTIVIDDELAMVGSANLDNRSFRLNFEILGAIYGPAAAGELAAHFERDLASARELRREDLAQQTRLERLASNFARLFATQL